MTHLDLFSGIGGFALAAKWSGFKTIAFCEIDDYAQKVLSKNFGAVMADAACGIGSQSQTGNGRQMFAGGSPKLFSDITKLDGKQFRGVSLLTAGVPCQPASVAGQRRGAEDDRWLWPQALRVFGECLPTWAIFENPPGILSLGDGVEFERVLSAVEGHGYTVQPIIIPACAVDARHRRDRVWIVANRTGGRLGELRGTPWSSRQPDQCGETVADTNEAGQRERRWGEPIREKLNSTECSGETLADSNGNGQRWRSSTEQIRGQRSAGEDGNDGEQRGTEWPIESGFRRVAHGIPNRVDRLRGLGNAIVPQVAYQIIKMIACSE